MVIQRKLETKLKLTRWSAKLVTSALPCKAARDLEKYVDVLPVQLKRGQTECFFSMLTKSVRTWQCRGNVLQRFTAAVLSCALSSLVFWVVLVLVALSFSGVLSHVCFDVLIRSDDQSQTCCAISRDAFSLSAPNGGDQCKSVCCNRVHEHISEVVHYHMEVELPSKAVEGQARCDGVGDGLYSACYGVPGSPVMGSTTMALDFLPWP